MSTAFIVLVLSLLLGLQPVTTDLYLPALPALTQDLGATVAQAQLTLSGLLLAFGLSQLVWGPISDRFGRRPVLLLGLATYVVGAVGGALAGSMEALLLWRIVQGAALGASVMCARALVRDLYSPELGARAISKGLTGLGVIACLSIPLGGVLAEFFGWRIALSAPALFGAATLALIALRFEETLQRPDPDALRPGTLVRTWLAILRNPTFLAFALLAAATYGGLFTLLAASSFVFIRLMELSRIEYAALMFVIVLAYVGGTLLCRRLLVRFGVQRTVAIGGVFSLLGGSLLGLGGIAGLKGVWPILLPMLIYMLGHGIHQPCGQAGAVGPFPKAAGAASAMSGFVMMVVAFAMGQWLGASMDGTSLPMIHGVWFWSVATAAVAWGLVGRVPRQA